MNAKLPLIAVLSVIGVACGGGVTTPGDEIDSGPVVTFQGAPSSVCPVANSKTVLVDPTHDGGTWWFPQSSAEPSGYRADSAHQGKALADYLRSKGYTVTELGRNARMSADSLLTYAVVIRAGYFLEQSRVGYVAGDLAAYDAFIACKRTLVMLGEFLRDGRQDDLANHLGIPLTGILTDNITVFSAHAITTGVTSIPYKAGSYLSSETNPSIHVLGRLPTGHAVMGVLDRGGAKIFFLGDVNGIQGVPQPLVNNLIAWGF